MLTFDAALLAAALALMLFIILRRASGTSLTRRTNSLVQRADIEVGGTRYRSVEDVPDPLVRERLRRLLNAAADGKIDRDELAPEDGDVLTIEEGFEPGLVVNGIRYRSVDDIPDPQLRRRVAGLRARRN